MFLCLRFNTLPRKIFREFYTSKIWNTLAIRGSVGKIPIFRGSTVCLLDYMNIEKNRSNSKPDCSLLTKGTKKILSKRNYGMLGL